MECMLNGWVVCFREGEEFWRGVGEDAGLLGGWLWCECGALFACAG